jgi:hypothetical protein
MVTCQAITARPDGARGSADATVAAKTEPANSSVKDNAKRQR